MDNSTENVGPERRVPEPPFPYWAKSIAQLFAEYKSRPTGLSAIEAAARLQTYGLNTLTATGHADAFRLLLKQFFSPLVLILIFAAFVAAAVGEMHDAVIIGCIVGASCLLGFSQEFSASRAVESLRRSISLTATVIRDGKEQTIQVGHVVPGDIIKLSAGSLVPADSVLLTAQDLNVTEAALTGETFPIAKSPGISTPDTPIDDRLNCVFTGTSVRSGIATALAVKTGNNTEFASIAEAVTREVPETDFARGIRRFGYLMTRIMLVIVFVVFIANLLLHRPLVDSLLMSLSI